MSNISLPITPGQTLSARSACDHDCVFTAEVIARKGAFATVRVNGGKEEKRVKVHAREGE